MNTELRKNCPMRHECGNCLPAGGFCTAVNDPICEALHNAYDTGWHAAFFRAQQAAERNEPQTNADAIRAMSDEELAEHLNDWQNWGGGLSTEMWLEWLQQPKDKEAKC